MSVAAMLKQLGESQLEWDRTVEITPHQWGEITAAIQAAEDVWNCHGIVYETTEAHDVLERNRDALARLRATLEKQP